MKVSELITELERLKEIHGDIPARIEKHELEKEIVLVRIRIIPQHPKLDTVLVIY